MRKPHRHEVPARRGVGKRRRGNAYQNEKKRRYAYALLYSDSCEIRSRFPRALRRAPRVIEKPIIIGTFRPSRRQKRTDTMRIVCTRSVMTAADEALRPGPYTRRARAICNGSAVHTEDARVRRRHVS